MVFTFNPWLTVFRHKEAPLYGNMAAALYANGIWNNFPDSDNTSWEKYEAVYGRHIMRNYSRKPLYFASDQFRNISISGLYNESYIDNVKNDGSGWFDYGPDYDLRNLDIKLKDVGGIPADFSQKKCLLFKAREAARREIQINASAGSIILYHAADLNPADEKLFNDNFRDKYKDPLYGIPVVKYTVAYADGSTEIFTVNFGYHISKWLIDSRDKAAVFSKYVYDSRTFLSFKSEKAKQERYKDDVIIYQYEWPNKRCNSEVKSISIEALGSDIGYALLGITIRGVK